MDALIGSAESITAVLKLGAAFIAFLVAFCALWWKISKSLVTTLKDLEDLETELGKFKKQVSRKLEQVTANQLEVTKSLVELATRSEEREKGILKLEGVVDAQRKDLIHLITTLQSTTSSIDALWKTLEKALPDKIPQRALDRKKGP